MKLLDVDDDPPLQTALLRLLGQWGYATEQASTAAAALAWLESELFDLGLLDLGLLDLGLLDRDGLSLCRQLRRLPGHQPLVLLLTAGDGRSDKVRGFGEGADDDVVKPFDPELLRAGGASLSKAELQRQIPGGFSPNCRSGPAAAAPARQWFDATGAMPWLPGWRWSPASGSAVASARSCSIGSAAACSWCSVCSP